ncbi:MAG: hypothetical protein ACOCRX_03155 [Candidatus Woesearchaeota archaeon]
MYNPIVHLGFNNYIPIKKIIGIFNDNIFIQPLLHYARDNKLIAMHMSIDLYNELYDKIYKNKFSFIVEKDIFIIGIDKEIKSLIYTNDYVYLSPIRANTLAQRCYVLNKD